MIAEVIQREGKSQDRGDGACQHQENLATKMRLGVEQTAKKR